MDAVKNFAKANLSAGIDAAVTALTLAAGGAAKMPAVPFNATIYNSTDYPNPADDPNVEIVRVTAAPTGEVYGTIVRGQEGSSAATHNTGGKTYVMLVTPTARTINSINRTIYSGVNLATFNTVDNTSYDVVIPGGKFEIGDFVEIYGLWQHTGALVNQPRVGLMWNGQTLAGTSQIAAFDIGAEVWARVFITGAAEQFGNGSVRRLDNGLTIATSQINGTDPIASATTIKFTWRMDNLGENLILRGVSITARKAV